MSNANTSSPRDSKKGTRASLTTSLRQTIRAPVSAGPGGLDAAVDKSLASPAMPRPTGFPVEPRPVQPAPAATAAPASPPQPAMTWFDLFSDGAGLDVKTADEYAAAFEKNDIPPPTPQICAFGIDNEVLQSAGISSLGHRVRILAKCRKIAAGTSQGRRATRRTGSTLQREESEEREEPVRMLPHLYEGVASGSDSEADENDGLLRSTHSLQSDSKKPAEEDRHKGDNFPLLDDDDVTVSKFVKEASDSSVGFVWVDMVGRDRDRTDYRESLMELSDKYGFAESLLVDIDLTLALPQVITSPEEPDQFLIILRVATECTDIEEDSLHLLTNRWMVAVNMENYTIVTIHRADCVSMAKLRSSWYKEVGSTSFSLFLCKILDDSLLAYIDALHESEFLLDQYESVMLKHSVGASGGSTASHYSTAAGREMIKAIGDPAKLTRQRMNQLLYHLHRRCSVYSRMLSLMQAALESAFTSLNLCSPEYAEQMSRSCGELAVKAESLHDNCQNLLNLHLSLVSFRTNELMGILTTFSAFFIPLTFICGVYGMNFVNMPELRQENGYYFCLAGMGLVCIAVYLFFRTKGLL